MYLVPEDLLAGFAGGLLIGLAAALLLLGSGRIAGLSGILAGILGSAGPAWRENAVFLAGLIAAPAAWAVAVGAPDIGISGSAPVLVAGGLLVGFGTRLGGSCTSGHGVCGVSRLSARSLAATAIFMAVAIATVTSMRLFGGG